MFSLYSSFSLYSYMLLFFLNAFLELAGGGRLPGAPVYARSLAIHLGDGLFYCLPNTKR